MKTKLHYVFSIAIFLFAFSAIAQNSVWKKIEKVKNPEKISKFNLDENKVHFFELNTIDLRQKLEKVSLRDTQTETIDTEVILPSENGEAESFKIFEVSVFSPELATKFPDIKSYVGYGVNNPNARLRMSISPLGVETMITQVDKPTVFMEPTSLASNEYILYSQNSKNKVLKNFHCQTIDDLSDAFSKNSAAKINEGGANTKTLQKFKIAISVTGEYTAYFGGTVSGALAGINATLNRVNDVFETDMAVTFELVDATQLIYDDAANDPYSDAEIGTDEANANKPTGWNMQLQTTLTNVIGESAYDIGHLFGASGGGGNAGCIGCVCVNGSKGSAYSSPGNGVPQGDIFDLDFVTHEIGHQMGASHTFSYVTEGTGVNSEPGSGSTIMGYAGTTDNDDVQLYSDPYFHYQSIKQILTNLSGKNCQTTTTFSNNPPLANAGNNYTIPKGTAYVLKGSATESDGDALTYCWEQTNSGQVSSANFSSALTSGSTNRSLPPSSSPNRYVPNLKSVLHGRLTESNPTVGSSWESVSTVSRSLGWALTVRDRNPLLVNKNGQTSYDTMSISVDGNSGPFRVTSQNTSGLALTPGDTETVTWDVANTSGSPVNTSNVNIRLSTDGGLTFPTILVSNTPNDGNQPISVPFISAPSCRIMVEAINNIFYAVNSEDFAINYTVVTTCNPTYSSPANLNLAINDASVTNHIINVPDSGTISKVKVTLNISHTYLDDLIVKITHPNGTTASRIWNRNCFDQNNIAVTFEDWASNIDCSSTAVGNTYAPAELLDVFNGLDAAGNWKVSILDVATGDNGTLNSWSLDICTQSTSLTNPDLQNSVLGFKVYPNPNNGNFWVAFNTIPEKDINILLFDIRGREILNKTYSNSGNAFREEINMNGIYSGMYLMVVTNGTMITKKKIIVE